MGKNTLGNINDKNWRKDAFFFDDKHKDDLKAEKQDSQGVFNTTTFRRFVTNKLGYPLEKHIYTTDDGYINTVYRIPGIKGTNPPLTEKNPQRPVVIYQHGLIDCCIGIVAAEEDSIGIRLVNMGYDLWLNNSRGNRYSRDHQKIDLDTCSKD